MLFLVTRIFKNADESEILSPGNTVYAYGDAPDSVRQEVISQLQRFQDGYTNRDIKEIDRFMSGLYSRENILILGTMPGEIYSGYERAARLVKSDWESWGDCMFGIENANISSSENAVWFSTRGLVQFDISRFLVLPLRLTGVMVKEDNTWKFRQQQFQFDIDFSFSLIAILLIAVWIFVSVIILIVKAVKLSKKS
jgi:hypothetical protein